MAMTYNETAETRFIFHLQSDNGTGTVFTTRTIAVPGQPTESAQTAFLNEVRLWRTDLIGTYSDSLALFIQPTNWRDNTGSSESDPPVAPYKTVGLEVELYTIQRTKWDDESLQPT